MNCHLEIKSRLTHNKMSWTLPNHRPGTFRWPNPTVLRNWSRQEDQNHEAWSPETPKSSPQFFQKDRRSHLPNLHGSHYRMSYCFLWPCLLSPVYLWMSYQEKRVSAMSKEHPQEGPSTFSHDRQCCKNDGNFQEERWRFRRLWQMVRTHQEILRVDL